MKINYHSIHVLLVCTRAYQPECGTITGIPHIHTLVLSLVLIIMETGSLLVSIPCIQNRIPAFQSLSKNTYIETKMSQFVQRIANYIANVRTDE
jgi:hypothetical protein